MENCPLAIYSISTAKLLFELDYSATNVKALSNNRILTINVYVNSRTIRVWDMGTGDYEEVSLDEYIQSMEVLSDETVVTCQKIGSPDLVFWNLSGLTLRLVHRIIGVHFSICQIVCFYFLCLFYIEEPLLESIFL